MEKMRKTPWTAVVLLAAAVIVAPNLLMGASAGEIQSRLDGSLSSSGQFSAMQCASCHQMESGFSHPVNVRAPAGKNPDLPLANGMITCLTCHDSGIDAHRLARTNHDPLLSAEFPMLLCVQCHDPADDGRVSQHALALGKAHLHTDRRSTHDNGLELETQNCLTCHDGLVSTDVTMGSRLSPDSPLGDHPVGVKYRSRQVDAAEVIVRPVSSLNPAIRLFDGQIGCGSCHSPYSTQEDLLVMSNHRSALCLSCHNQ